jgi:hypothetical protein
VLPGGWHPQPCCGRRIGPRASVVSAPAHRWSVNPRLRIDYRDNSNDSTQWNFAPAVRTQYQADRHIVFSEGGLIYYRTKYSDLDDRDFKIWFAYLGYRYSF